MIILLLQGRYPDHWEPSRIWYAAGVEALFIDAPLLGILWGVIIGSWV